jgi:isopropylmalate/homocitrate/citramalate synthase
MEDKVRIAQRLDALGIHYIECGWPGSNPKDLPVFKRIPDAVFTAPILKRSCRAGSRFLIRISEQPFRLCAG